MLVARVPSVRSGDTARPAFPIVLNFSYGIVDIIKEDKYGWSRDYGD